MDGTPYKFQVRDRSILLPYYARWLWDPVTNSLPRWVSPNSITLVSNFFSGLAFVLLILNPQGSAGLMLAAAAFNFIYFTLDNVDGRQARRTNSCSALGEFLDHWFDAWNIGLLVLCLGRFLELPEPIFLPMMIVCSLGFFLTYWEQYRTGCVQLGYVGVNEGLTAVPAILVVGAIVGKSTLILPVVLGISTCDIFFVLMGLGFLAVIIATCWRNLSASGDVLGIAAAHAVIFGWYLAGTLPLAAAATLMVLAHVVHTGSVLSARLLKERYASLDPLTLAAVAGGCMLAGFSPLTQTQFVIFTIVGLVLMARIAVMAITTINLLRKVDQARSVLGAS